MTFDYLWFFLITCFRDFGYLLINCFWITCFLGCFFDYLLLVFPFFHIFCNLNSFFFYLMFPISFSLNSFKVFFTDIKSLVFHLIHISPSMLNFPIFFPFQLSLVCAEQLFFILHKSRYFAVFSHSSLLNTTLIFSHTAVFFSYS